MVSERGRRAGASGEKVVRALNDERRERDGERERVGADGMKACIETEETVNVQRGCEKMLGCQSDDAR